MADNNIHLDLNEGKKLDRSFQGLAYVLGFVARKFKTNYPELGKQISNLTPDEIQTSLCSWLFVLSNRGGGLTVPSPEFIKDGEIMEEEFNKFHSSDIGYNKESWVIDKFTDVLVTIFDKKYDRKVLACFSKTRTFIRIKDLNIVLKDKITAEKGTREHRQIGNLKTYKLTPRTKKQSNTKVSEQPAKNFKCIFCPLSFVDAITKEMHVFNDHHDQSFDGAVPYMPTF